MQSLGFGSSKGRLTTQACGYFYRVQRITHPLRHLLMINWLHEDWASFMEAYREYLDGGSSHRTPQCTNANEIGTEKSRVDTELREACVNLSINRQLSATAIASELGVAVATAISHLAAAGIQTTRRPKLLRGAKQTDLRRALREGMAKPDAARLAGVSVETVTRFLLSDVGLHELWVKVRQQTKLLETRHQWLTLLSGNQATPVTLLRAIAPAAYIWLHRNDREWLDATLKDRKSKVYAAGRRVSWEVRDKNLVNSLHASTHELIRLGHLHQIRVTHILQLVPALKPFVGRLDRLPNTKQLLDKILRSRHPKFDDLFSTDESSL